MEPDCRGERTVLGMGAGAHTLVVVVVVVVAVVCMPGHIVPVVPELDRMTVAFALLYAAWKVFQGNHPLGMAHYHDYQDHLADRMDPVGHNFADTNLEEAHIVYLAGESATQDMLACWSRADPADNLHLWRHHFPCSEIQLLRQYKVGGFVLGHGPLQVAFGYKKTHHFCLSVAGHVLHGDCCCTHKYHPTRHHHIFGLEDLQLPPADLAGRCAHTVPVVYHPCVESHNVGQSHIPRSMVPLQTSLCLLLEQEKLLHGENYPELVLEQVEHPRCGLLLQWAGERWYYEALAVGDLSDYLFGMVEEHRVVNQFSIQLSSTALLDLKYQAAASESCRAGKRHLQASQVPGHTGLLC